MLLISSGAEFGMLVVETIAKIRRAYFVHEKAILRKYGEQVDIFVANAAIGETGPAAEIPIERYRAVFEINIFRTVELVQKFATIFAKRGSGTLVVTSSTAGLRPYPFLAPSTASKHAVEAIFQLKQSELEPLGVQVATINPAPFNTGFNDRMYATIDQWFRPGRNFTPEGPLRQMQGMLADPAFQHDPKAMIDVIVNVIPQDTHQFHTVFPPEFGEDAKKHQDDLWRLKIAPKQAGSRL